MTDNTTSLAASLTSTAEQRNRRYRNESNVKYDLSKLMDALGYGPVETEHAIVDGFIDIYIPHHRVIIETKQRGLADDPYRRQPGAKESPKEQLDRYVLSEILKELHTFEWDPDNQSKHPWVGVVTDGRAWHTWRYPHVHHPEVETVLSTTIDSTEALIGALRDAFGTERAGKQWVPVAPADLFRDHAAALVKLYRQLPRDVRGRTETKRRLWLDMLHVSGIAPHDNDIDRLFVTHSLLIAIARIVTHALAPQGKEDWKVALRDGFVSWITDTPLGREWADDLHQTIENHDWKRRQHDVMQPLYLDFVSADDRKVFGEYYTPDWLAALMVREALDDAWLANAVERAESAARTGFRLQGLGVLDPTCGSGTFLYHAARRILDAPGMKDLSAVRQADIAASLVHGIDVHPVAVEIAKTNMMRVLPTAPTMGDAAIQIRMGDSLMTEGAPTRLFEVEGTMRIVTPKRHEILLPMNFVRRHNFADDMGRVVSAAVRKTQVPAPLLSTLEAADRKGLEEARDALAKAIDDEGNSVWTWYVVNVAAPKLLSEHKVDRIVANPPWVKLSDIQHEPRKRAMEKFGESLGIYQGGRQAPHTDIAAFFIKRTRELYLQEPKKNPAIWLVKKSSLRAGHWAAFRELHGDTLAQSIDLEDLEPFGGGDATRCCLLLEQRPMADTASSKHLRAMRKVDEGTKKPVDRPRSDEAPETALERIRFTATAKRTPEAPSGYLTLTGKPVFRQGATVLPHVLTIAEKTEPAAERSRIRVTTRESKKSPWSSVQPRTIEIPKQWLLELCTTNSMAAFVTRTIKAIIPRDATGNLLKERNIDEEGWFLLDQLYRTHAGRGRHTPGSLLDQVDHLRKLRVQLPLRPETQRKLVLYPKSGDIMRAARHQAGHAVVDHSLYWYHAPSAGKAAYLTIVLNTSCLQQAYADSRTSGRDFHLQPWRKVPIPRYDRTVALHREIAALCTRAEKIAARTVDEALRATSGKGQLTLSKAVRTALTNSGVWAAMDECARQLLPKHAE